MFREHLIFFNWPQAALLLLFLVPLLIGFYLLNHYRRNQIGNFADPQLIKYLLIPRSQQIMWTKVIGWGIIWVLCSFALMEPIGNLRYPPLPASPEGELQIAHYAPHEVIFLMDTSASMGVPDGPEKETRLEEGKKIMTDVIRQLSGQTVSLYAFTSVLSSVVPPTLDYLFVRLALTELHLDEGDVGGTSFAPVLKSLTEEVFSNPAPKKITMIILSDGGDTQLESLTDDAQKIEIKAIVGLLPNPVEYHLKFFTVGLGQEIPQPIPDVVYKGKPVSSGLEPKLLEAMAAREDGTYYTAREWSSWDLAKDIVNKMGEDPLVIPQGMPVEREVSFISRGEMLFDLYYQIPLGVAILFYLINIMLPDVRRI